MADSPLLSICIPTYNRAAPLSQALNAIIAQLTNKSLCEQIEIVVSDNASSDDTQELVMRLKAANPHIHLIYLCHQRNLGPDANIYAAAKAAQGVFVYILSDDDVLLPGALAKLLTELATTPELAALCPNSCFTNNGMRETATPTFSIDSDYLVFDKNEVLTRLGVMLTFLSCLVFRSDTLSEKDYTDRLGTSLLQSFIFLEVLARGDGCLFIKQPCLAVRTNDAVSYDLFEVFGTNFHALMKYAKQLEFSPDTVDAVLCTQAKWLAGMVYHFKRTGSYRWSFGGTAADLGRLWSMYKRHPLALGRVLVAIMLPPNVFAAVSGLFRRARSAS